MSGVHKGGLFGNPLPGWSFINGVTPITIKVEASYPDGTIKALDIDPNNTDGDNDKKTLGVGFRGRVKGTLPTNNGLRATDYGVTAVGSPQTKTTLAYVTGAPGSFAHSDLALLNDVFVGGDEFLVPMLSDPIADLFVAVDLVQWLTFGGAFNIGDTFSITDGTSPDLPGFFISRSESTFDPVNGYTAPDPVTGVFPVGGTIDGGNIPEPSTGLMLLVGSIALWFISRSRRLH